MGHSRNAPEPCRDTSSCLVGIDGVQIGFVLGSCRGEGVKIGISFNKPGDDEVQAGGEEGESEGRGEITPGELTKGLENETDDPSENADLSALTKLSDSQLKKIVGDAHEFKGEFVGKKRVSHFDVYKDKKSGYLFLLPKGGGTPIPTGYLA